MPIVDYNRIYHVRSRERQPVLYSPHMVPDRAGAFLRATAPGIRARLEDADARARQRQGNLRAQYAALGNLIKVGGQVGESYARAVERRDQADFDALAAAWQTHMNAGAEQAYRRPYVRGGENGEGADGPMRAIEELDASFDESDAFQNARDGVKERFAAWRAKSRIPYANKAAQRQSDLNDLYQKNALEARFASADGKIATFYGIGEDGSFNDAVEEKVNAAVARTAWEYERIGAVLPESERSRIASGIREKALFDRAKFRCAQFAAGDTVPTEADDELLAAARELSQDGSAITDDTMRLALKNRIDAARQQRVENIGRAQGVEVREISGEVSTLTYGFDPDTKKKFDPATRDARLTAAKQRAWSIMDPATRSKLLSDIDETEAHFAYGDFMSDLLETAGPMENPTELFETGNEDAFDALMQRAEGIKNEVARAKAVEFLATGRANMADLEEKQARELARVEGIAMKEAQERTKNSALTAIILGFEEVSDKDGNKARRELTPEMKAERFRHVFPALSPSEVEKYSSKIIDAANDGVAVTEQDIDLVGAAAGVAKLSSLFSANASGAIAPDKKKANKSGMYDVNPPGWFDEFEMPVDALLDMVESIRQYKAAVAVAGPSGIKRPEEILASILADKSAFRGYCADAQRRANAEALKEYRRAIGRSFIAETEEEGQGNE